MKFMPASTPACSARIDSSSSTAPHEPPIAHAPNPIADTVMSVRPSLRCSIGFTVPCSLRMWPFAVGSLLEIDDE